MIWLVIWVVFVIFWLFGGGHYIYNSPNPNLMWFGTGTFIPWLCVLVVGLVAFGVLDASAVRGSTTKY